MASKDASGNRVHPHPEEDNEHRAAGGVHDGKLSHTGTEPKNSGPALPSHNGKVQNGKGGIFDSISSSNRLLHGKSGPKHTWKLLAQAAVLVKAISTTEAGVIDIYHDRKSGQHRFMIHPNSKFRRLWEILTALCVLYVCTVIPLVIGFSYVDWSGVSGMNTFLDWYFIIDMVMTLRTGIFSNGDVIMDSSAVARRYFRTWFIVDLISNFPLSWFVQTSGKSIKIVKLQKLPKLLRFGRLLKYLREYAKYYNLVLSFIALGMGVHWFACIWAAQFSHCINEFGDVHCNDSEMGRMYLQSAHTIVLMFLGIAESSTYSDISHLLDPHTQATPELYCTSLFVFLLGMIFSSFFFGNILTLLMSWDQQKAQFRNRMDIISAEMRYYELPEDLQHRVRRNYDYLWINQRAYSDMMLLNQPGISKTLRTTIALHLYKDLVKTVPFFAGSDARFLGKVCLALETAVYLPGDTIIYQDDIGKEMFIVRKGLVEILIPEEGNPDKRIYLRDGNFFGETALVIDVRRTNTVKAVNICDLNVLSKHAFNEIVAEYPEFGERMKRTVIKRQLDNMNIQSPTEKLKVQNQLNLVVEKSLKARRMSISLRTIYRAKKLGDKLKEIADRAAKSNQASTRRVSKGINRVVPARSLRGEAQMSELGLGAPLDPIKSGITHAQPPSYRLRQTPHHRVTTTLGSPEIIRPSPPLVNQSSTSSMNGSTRTIARIDAVSRKLSKAELTLDLIPSALLEISSMVNQIKRTTDRLSRHIQQTENTSSDEDDIDADDDYQLNSGYESDKFDVELPSIPPLSEEHEEEVARRESNSVIYPKEDGSSFPSADTIPVHD